MNQQGFSCTCPKHCNGPKCENCTKAKFQLETGYPALMFFNKGKTKGILHRGPRDLITLTDFVYEQLDGEHTNVKNESTKMLEAGCKEKDWEYDKNGEPYEYSWKPSGILLETGVCIENTYRKEFVPRKGVTRVHSTIEYQKVRDVDAKKKTISMDFTLTMQWLDRRIKAHLLNKESGIVLGPNSVDHIWTPDVRILNRTSFKSKNELFSLVGAKVLTKNETKKLVSSNIFKTSKLPTGLQIRYDVKTSVFCPFDYTNYPMDEQTCHVGFGSGSLGAIFTLHDNPKKFHKSTKYKAENFDMTVTFFDQNVSTGENTVGMIIHMKRLRSSYLWKYYIPCICIVLVTELGFAVPVTAIPGRIGLLVTQFLTLINLFIHQMSESPSASDLNKLGSYLLFCLLFVVCALVEFSIIMLLDRKRIAKRKGFDTKSINQQVAHSEPLTQEESKVNPLFTKRNDIDSKSQCVETDQTEKRGRMQERNCLQVMSHIQSIDLISSLLFLFIFFVFNCFYWQ